jgi:hypothetical protein
MLYIEFNIYGETNEELNRETKIKKKSLGDALSLFAALTSWTPLRLHGVSPRRQRSPLPVPPSWN